MKQPLLTWFIGFTLILLAGQRLHAQCTSGCTFTATSNGNYNLNGSQKLCIPSSVSNLSINFNGSSNSICVGTGATWTQSNGGNLSNVIIDVYGTLILNGGYNFNGPVVINVQAGGVLQTNTSGFGSNLTINNYGTTTYTSTGSINNQGTFILTNFAGATLSAPNATLFKMDSGTSLFNFATMSFSNLENQDANIQNYPNSTLTVGRSFNNHGNFINSGTVSIPCSSGTGTCEFIVGNKGPGKEFTNNGCMTVNGDVTFNGPGFINGTLELLTPNILNLTLLNSLTLNSIVSGTNGRIIVDNGLSTIGVAGQYTGTNMKFCDRNSILNGNRFDFNLGNLTSTYTVDCSSNTCAAVACALSISATPGSCSPATNQYSVTGTVSLTNNSAGGTLTITDGSSTTAISVVANATSATYSLTGLVSNGSSHTVTASLSGCGSASQTYTAPASCSCTPLTVTTSSSASAICQGQSVSLSAQVSPTGSYTYTWAGNGTITNGNTATATVSGLSTGTNTFTLTVRSNSVCSTTAVRTVIVNPAVTATLTSSTSAICQGQSATLTAGGGTIFQWSTGQTTAVISATASGTYSVTVSNAQGCSGTASTSLTVNPTPSLTLSSVTLCAGQSTALTVGGCTTGTLIWSTGSQTSSLTVVPLVTTAYSATCTAQTGCSSSVAASITITASPSYTAIRSTAATCTAGIPNSNGIITLTGVTNTARADISTGSSYTGPAFNASTNQVPVGGTLSFANLPNPTSPQSYTVRLFSASGTCSTDVTVILYPAVCPCPYPNCIPVAGRKATR